MCDWDPAPAGKVVSINSTSYKRSDFRPTRLWACNDWFPLIPLPIKEAIVALFLVPYMDVKLFPLIPLPIKEAM